jgi:hypothetical protein
MRKRPATAFIRNPSRSGVIAMLKETELREATYQWIEALPKGTIFSSEQMYRFPEENFPIECGKRGDTSNEPRYRNDARWAVRDAKDRRIAESTSRRAQYKRI